MDLRAPELQLNVQQVLLLLRRANKWCLKVNSDHKRGSELCLPLPSSSSSH